MDSGCSLFLSGTTQNNAVNMVDKRRVVESTQKLNLGEGEPKLPDVASLVPLRLTWQPVPVATVCPLVY